MVAPLQEQPQELNTGGKTLLQMLLKMLLKGDRHR